MNLEDSGSMLIARAGIPLADLKLMDNLFVNNFSGSALCNYSGAWSFENKRSKSQELDKRVKARKERKRKNNHKKRGR